jgi:hypothetical protein
MCDCYNNAFLAAKAKLENQDTKAEGLAGLKTLKDFLVNETEYAVILLHTEAFNYKLGDSESDVLARRERIHGIDMKIRVLLEQVKVLLGN